MGYKNLFYNLYDKKVGRPKALDRFKKLKDSEIEAIMEFIPKYKLAKSDKQFRKDPAAFINQRTWEDEIIGESIPDKNQPAQKGSFTFPIAAAKK